ncbi:MAG: glycosyltransferase [Chloroflexi bacterium]|nr:glycosyltransferase [Chloroflexota bacterium]
MKRHRDKIASILLFLADLLCLSLVAGAAIYIRYNTPLLPYPHTPSLWISHLVLVAVVCLTLFPTLILNGAYRAPRRWQANEALPIVLKAILLAFPISTVLLFALRFGIPRTTLVPTPSRLITGLIWSGLLVSLTCTRLLLGRLQLAMYRSGLWIRRCIIVGDAPQATQLTRHIEHHPWLGEQIIGRVGYEPGPDRLGKPANLADLIKRHHVDVVWLAPPTDLDNHSLPPLLFEPEGDAVIWRALPKDWAHFTETILPRLNFEQIKRFHERLEHHLALSTLRIAMLGSRGVPANYSGIEKYVEEIGSYLAQQGARVVVYCHAKYVSERSRHRGMELRFVPTISTKHMETIVHTFLATLDALLQGEEIFHYQAIGPATLAWLPRLFGRKVVTTVQGLDWERAKWGWGARQYLKFGEWAACHFPHATIVVSQALGQHYAERHGKKTIRIPNGFEAPVRQPPHLIKEMGLSKNGYILFVGRLSPEKQCHTLIQAFAQTHSDKHLVLAGRATYDDDYYQRLLTEADGLDTVHFTGFVQDAVLQELYSNAYLVVLPSELEGLSIALLEALSYGNCLLVSDVPENLEITGDAGFSFQNGDATALAQQMQWLLDHPEQVQAARTRTQARASKLMDWRKVAKATQRLYESLYD